MAAGTACQMWPCMAIQEWNESYSQILPWINMAGDISRCRFLPLECVINFTKNGQKGPFKGSPITHQLALTHVSSVLFP